MYGKIFHVVAVENPNNMAYTNMPLPYHQDLWYFSIFFHVFKIIIDFCSYYDDIPGVQLLHCVKNDVAGGENGFVDGFNVCQKLKQIYPEAFETLAKTRITFQKIDNTDHRVK